MYTVVSHVLLPLLYALLGSLLASAEPVCSC